MYFVYVLRSLKDGTFYTGLTNDVARRIAQHNKGQERTTRPHLPFEVVLTESYATRVEARAREKYFKSGQGREYIKAL